MRIDLNDREVTMIYGLLVRRRKTLARRKPSNKQGEASSLAMEMVSIQELEDKLAAAFVAAALERERE